MAPATIGLAVVVGLLAHSGPIAAPTAGGVPSPANSEVPGLIISCPAGDTEYRIVVRDGLNNPGTGDCALLFIDPCMGHALCPGFSWETCSIGSGPQTPCDSAGVARFRLAMGGTCNVASGSVVRVYADGALLKSISAASPDQDGDLDVDPADGEILAAKLVTGMYNATADLFHDGRLDALDWVSWEQHRGHRCAGAVGVVPTNWGALKLLYR